MVIVGAVVGHKRPLIMARKKIREFEETLLEEEEEMELDDEDVEEEFEEYQEEVVEEVEVFEDEPVEEPEKFAEEDVQEEVQDKNDGIIDLSDRRVV
jgi:hypothetical protein